MIRRELSLSNQKSSMLLSIDDGMKKVKLLWVATKFGWHSIAIDAIQGKAPACQKGCVYIFLRFSLNCRELGHNCKDLEKTFCKTSLTC